eukprot:CAMPEP_0119022306 /NCGR_PEP_ID=MMETSP1176-20130426/27682_1 /TAXON_ID=265551 /ORGANISM="Synedropsis recta cf, Strain CCMP1620" /LENGTH=413 /DNA_ID=CAMNT_0006977109 /DNA_START=173 /DNA_END=1410 /DNA_ORIENTATION=-
MKARNSSSNKNTNILPAAGAEITMTNFGFRHPNDAIARKVGRTMAAKEFMLAIEAHDRYNASAWDDLHHRPDANRPIIAFLDIDTILLLHWPKFGGDHIINTDTEENRPAPKFDFAALCGYCEQALRSPAMAAADSRLVMLHGGPDGPPDKSSCAGFGRDKQLSAKLIVGHMSAHKNQTHPHDFGLPSWSVKPATLSETQLRNVETCRDDRKYLLSFQGRGRAGFPEFTKYMQEQSKIALSDVYASFGVDHYKKSPENNSWGGKVLSAVSVDNQTQDDYYSLMMDTTFCPTPRGDKLYSVRFGEALSAGCIPVIFADGWVLPYNRDVVDWSEISVLLPQRRVRETVSILQNISKEARCQMQQGALAFYNDYVKDSHGRLRAILKLVDSRIRQTTSTRHSPDHGQRAGITNFSS